MPNNATTKQFLSGLPRLWVVVCWAKWTVIDTYDSGKVDEKGQPLIWMYDDFNGCCDSWWLRPIRCLTTGAIKGWYKNENEAREVAAEMEQKRRKYLYETNKGEQIK